MTRMFIGYDENTLVNSFHILFKIHRFLRYTEYNNLLLNIYLIYKNESLFVNLHFLCLFLKVSITISVQTYIY